MRRCCEGIIVIVSGTTLHIAFLAGKDRITTLVHDIHDEIVVIVGMIAGSCGEGKML